MQELRAKTQARDENQARIDAKIQAREAAKLMEAERRAAENAEKENAAVAADAAKDGDEDDEDEDDLFGENEDDEKEDAGETAPSQQQENEVAGQPEVRSFVKSLGCGTHVIIFRSTYGQTSPMKTIRRKKMGREKLNRITMDKRAKMRPVRIYQMWRWQTSLWIQMSLRFLPRQQPLNGDSTSMTTTMKKISWSVMLYACVTIISCPRLVLAMADSLPVSQLPL